MENYIVSARKYRPDTFDTVVGQEALTTTLKNAISSNKLAHAYLFCGPRGVGKTTCARIFAKTINCLHKTAEGEACNECESCVAFNEQRSYNIHELDAASNNTVEDIRQLIEMVRVQPQVGKYRVFIIDEVHMLSTQAFNAFLKTLEEPPAHAIFILATTEKHKLLPTILSRCQIYDFNRISVQDIVAHLMRVAQQESVQAEEEALNVIAVKSDGGMRDALSMFDQAVSYTGGNLTYQGVLENLNVLDYDYYFRIVDAVLSKNIVESLLTFNEILNKGFEGNSFLVGLNSHFRDLLVSKDDATLKLLQTAASIRDRYRQQAQKCSIKFIFSAMKLCRDCELNYKVSKNKRLLVELTLIELAQLDESEGERPLGQNKKLKPIFNTDQVATVATSTVKQAQTATASQAVTKPNQSASQHYLSGGNSIQNQPSRNAETQKGATHTAPSVVQEYLSTPESSKRKPPVLKGKGIGTISLKLNKHKEEGTPNNSIAQKTEEEVEQKKSAPIIDSDLSYQWHSFIHKMPIEQKALAVRMKAMHISLIPETFSFEVVLDNELVANEFKVIKPSVENFMRKALNNDFIEMIIRVSEVDETIRAYSKVEKYQMMCEKNKHLDELREKFGLEFNS